MSTTFVIAPALHRQPLAPVRRQRIRALQQTKLSALNKLNAIIPSTPLKRSISYDSDGENVAPAPAMKQDATKRKRAADDDDQLSECPKALKASRISLAPVDNNHKTREISTPRKVNVTMGKPAGRSPLANSKHGKAFGRRSLASNTTIRDASLTKSKPALLSSRKVSQPASWMFNIHVDTPDEEATNTMQHFAGRLDISDDEGKANMDDRGKENIPPNELGIAMPTATQLAATLNSRKNMMAQSRSPLGELKTSDYYAPGLHGLSYAVIHDENLKGGSDILHTPVESEPVALPKSLSLAVIAEECDPTDQIPTHPVDEISMVA